MNSKNNKAVGKLIRGVVYDDIDINEMQDFMVEYMYHGYTPSLTQGMVDHAADVGLSEDAALCFTNNMNALEAITRYNVDTGVTHNLIIPKEALSVGLVDELKKVDLAKGIMEAYIHKTHEYNDVVDVEPEDFCDSEEEDLLSHLDNATFIIDGKKVSKEELLKNPVALEAINNLINGTFFKKAI